MKKILIISLLFSAIVMQACNVCDTAKLFPNKFHFVKAYTHGAPVESVGTICNCGDTKFVIIAGYTSANCTAPVSIRAYSIDVNNNNALTEVAIDLPHPSDFLYAVETRCFQQFGIPMFGVVGCPDADGNVFWGYIWNAQYERFEQIVKWGANETPKPSVLYAASANPLICGAQQNCIQLAVAGQAVDGIAKVWIIELCALSVNPFIATIATQHVIDLGITQSTPPNELDGAIFALAWLPATTPLNNCTCNIPCTVLSVGGKRLEGEDCRFGNIHNFTVDCDGNVLEIASIGTDFPPVIDWGAEWTIRRLIWSDCCAEYPYPFLLAIGDKPNLTGGFDSKIIVYYYVPSTGQFRPLAFKDMPGYKLFAGRFTPNCHCTSITVAGGKCPNPDRCKDNNIINLSFACPSDKIYPVEMTIGATSTFDDFVTSLAFCQETNCWSMIVTSETANYSSQILDPLCPPSTTRGEIGVYKVFFCPTGAAKPCIPVAICERKANQMPARKR